MSHRERNDGIVDNNRMALARYRYAVSCLGDRPRNIVDLGCGLGYGSYMLRQAGHDVMGVDNSIEAIEYARDKYPGQYMTADLEIVPFNGYEVATCFEVLCHLKDPQSFLDRLDVPELIISAPIDPDPDDGYRWRLHNLSEIQFRQMVGKWKLVSERWQRKQYLILYLKI